jgi:HEAT repeat protein
MMGGSRANEIPELVRQLGSRSPARVDGARARLSIIGERAVEGLIEGLEGDNNRIRANAMPLLAVIQDTRAREPLTAMLLDRNARLRAIAARSLARFPCQNSVRALNRLLEREAHEEVKVAAVQSLIEHYQAGREEALRQLLPALVDPGEPAQVRLATLALLRTLPPSQRRGILTRLHEDPQEEIREKAQEISSSLKHPAEPTSAEIARLIQDLGSDDYSAWNEAVQRLAGYGAKIVLPLVTEMQARAHDPEYCTRAGMALKSLGPRRARPLADTLDQVQEALPLQVLIEVIGAVGEKSMIYRLKDVIDRVAEMPVRDNPGRDVDPFQRARAKAHLELARIGSRVAIRDLRNALTDDGQRVELELLAAVELVGKREELGVLLQAYDREDEFVKRRITTAVREIMKRERIRRSARLFQNLSENQRRALERILVRASSTGRRRPPAARATV